MVVESCFFCFGCIDIALAKLGRTSAFHLTLPYLDMCVCRVKKLFLKNKLELKNLCGLNKGRGPFRCPERRFGIFALELAKMGVNFLSS